MAFVASTVVGVHDEPEPTQYLIWIVSPVPVVAPVAVSEVPCRIEFPAENVMVTELMMLPTLLDGMMPFGG